MSRCSALIVFLKILLHCCVSVVFIECIFRNHRFSFRVLWAALSNYAYSWDTPCGFISWWSNFPNHPPTRYTLLLLLFFWISLPGNTPHLRTSSFTQTHIRNLSAVMVQDGRPVSDNAITSTLWPLAPALCRYHTAGTKQAVSSTAPLSKHSNKAVLLLQHGRDPSSHQNNLSSIRVVHYWKNGDIIEFLLSALYSLLLLS